MCTFDCECGLSMSEQFPSFPSFPQPHTHRTELHTPDLWHTVPPSLGRNETLRLSALKASFTSPPMPASLPWSEASNLGTPWDHCYPSLGLVLGLLSTDLCHGPALGPLLLLWALHSPGLYRLLATVCHGQASGPRTSCLYSHSWQQVSACEGL